MRVATNRLLNRRCFEKGKKGKKKTPLFSKEDAKTELRWLIE
jgi:hypothetical protein